MPLRIHVDRSRSGEAPVTIAPAQSWDTSQPPHWNNASEPVPAELSELAWEQLSGLAPDAQNGSLPVTVGDAVYTLHYSREASGETRK